MGEPVIDVPVDRYLARIGFSGAPRVDLATLQALQLAHMTSVPFENIDVYSGIGVTADPGDALAKVVDRGRGGWCFELNGAFSVLLEAIGFEVTRLGAAVLLSGPSVVVDHLCLEVALDEPYLVDVGFGDGFTRPIALNRAGPQDGGVGTFELLPSPQGTTLTREVDGAPAAQYRFKRVGHRPADFEPASRRLQDDKTLWWHQRAFATRLLGDGEQVDRIDGARGGDGVRVTLMGTQLKHQTGDETTEVEIAEAEWSAVLADVFDMSVELDGPPRRP